MTNKELAVQLYSAFMQSAAILCASPNFHGKVATPSLDEMVEQVEKLTAKLSHIQDN